MKWKAVVNGSNEIQPIQADNLDDLIFGINDMCSQHDIQIEKLVISRTTHPLFSVRPLTDDWEIEEGTAHEKLSAEREKNT